MRSSKILSRAVRSPAATAALVGSSTTFLVLRQIHTISRNKYDAPVASDSEKKVIESMVEKVKANMGYTKPVVIKYKPDNSYSRKVRNMEVESYPMQTSVITIYNPNFYAQLENQTELKTTLTHEFGHLAKHHCGKTIVCIGTMMVGSFGITASYAVTHITPTPIGIIAGLPMISLSMTACLSVSILLLAYMRRQHEFEADNAIVKYCSRDEVEANIKSFEERALNERLSDLPKIPLLETHPCFWDRSANLKKQMQKKDERDKKCMRRDQPK